MFTSFYLGWRTWKTVRDWKVWLWVAFFQLSILFVDQRTADSKMEFSFMLYFNYPDNCWLFIISNVYCKIVLCDISWLPTHQVAKSTSLFAISLNFGFFTFSSLLHLFALLCFPNVFTGCWGSSSSSSSSRFQTITVSAIIVPSWRN